MAPSANNFGGQESQSSSSIERRWLRLLSHERRRE
jgi:hypothetical protein